MNLVEVAQETLAITRQGEYLSKNGIHIHIAPDIGESIAGTRLYTPEHLAGLLGTRQEKSGVSGPPAVEITPETTAIAARRLYEAGMTGGVALNFASAKNPGGGFLTGAKSQEEDLARCSALYECLLPQTGYYEANRAYGSMLYTDYMIYSPGVPFFRDERLNLLDRPFLPAIITAPAPNAGEFLRREPDKEKEIEVTLKRRAGMVLCLAAEQGHRTLVLGAWGCGVFRNNPAQVARAFAEWLSHPGFAGAFDLVVFGIYEREANRPFLETFKRELAG
ncbi:MAG: TIGR02452 family protein [Chloroflexi bacterium]|nr:TIGR02452 family protein [Chloroflexota bacterium]OJV89394.1 MAG: TIGR02452 family protein [Chloroflexi bacterium 54-19]